jgi:hypothetical protein
VQQLAPPHQQHHEQQQRNSVRHVDGLLFGTAGPDAILASPLALMQQDDAPASLFLPERFDEIYSVGEVLGNGTYGEHAARHNRNPLGIRGWSRRGPAGAGGSAGAAHARQLDLAVEWPLPPLPLHRLLVMSANHLADHYVVTGGVCRCCPCMHPPRNPGGVCGQDIAAAAQQGGPDERD